MQRFSTLDLALAALLLEAAVGYPDVVYRAIGHPVTWIGRLIGWLDRRFNRGSARRLRGVMALLVVLAITGGAASGLDQLRFTGPLGVAFWVVAASSLLAQRSLDTHVRAVATALTRHGLPAGRVAVSMIVGRNPERLDEAGVARAAIESLAENFSDGVVAPAVWLAVGGLVGGASYKAVNTADSMIGHRTERHALFGWGAARLDDLVNLPASRLSAALLVAAAGVTGGSARGAMRAIWRDARRHRSPNAGWPEAAVAGALGLKLAGPRVYGETLVEDTFMGDGRRDAGTADILRALRLYRAACVIQWLTLLAVAVIARA